MLQLYYWPTPNGHKITLFLEEAGLPYELVPVDITKGDQFQPEFLKISPNNRMPALVDTEPKIGTAPISVFESGAILEYLADKTGKFLPTFGDPKRYETLQWLYWQMGGLGPMAGQNHHFNRYAPEKIAYAINRYVKETARLYGVLDKRLADRDYISGDSYTIADMASYPWIVAHEAQGQNLNDFPNLKKWFDRIAAKASVKTAYEKGKAVSSVTSANMTDEARKILFGFEKPKNA
ncbi:MAG: glutathione S-transferase N-terminal domain-containing protein [Bdellovibrionota bacterium]